MKMPSKKAVRKQLVEISAFAAIIMLLFYTGVGQEISSYLQRGVLWTGLVNAADTKEDLGRADFNFDIRDLNGQRYDFAQWKGKVVFLNLWATWCPPCIAEMPSIANLAESLAANNEIVFVLLTSEQDTEKVAGFLDKRGWDLPVYQQNSSLPDIFRSGAIPTTFVIDTDGRVVYKKTGIANYDHADFKMFLNSLAQ